MLSFYGHNTQTCTHAHVDKYSCNSNTNRSKKSPSVLLCHTDSQKLLCFIQGSSEEVETARTAALWRLKRFFHFLLWNKLVKEQEGERAGVQSRSSVSIHFWAVPTYWLAKPPLFSNTLHWEDHINLPLLFHVFSFLCILLKCFLVA